MARVANSAAGIFGNGIAFEDARNAWRSARCVSLNAKRGAVVELVARHPRSDSAPKIFSVGGAWKLFARFSEWQFRQPDFWMRSFPTAVSPVVLSFRSRGATQQKCGDGFCFGCGQFEVRHWVAGKMRLGVLEVSGQSGWDKFFSDVIEVMRSVECGLAWEGVARTAVEVGRRGSHRLHERRGKDPTIVIRWSGSRDRRRWRWLFLYRCSREIVRACAMGGCRKGLGFSLRSIQREGGNRCR